MAEASWEQKQAELEGLRSWVAKRTRLNRWFALVVLVAFLAAAAVPAYRYARTAAVRSQCFTQEKAVEAEAKTFRSKNLDFPNTAAEVPSGKGIVCPGGGDYTWDPVTGELTCSQHGHWTASE